jgi:hypothetical protein
MVVVQGLRTRIGTGVAGLMNDLAPSGIRDPAELLQLSTLAAAKRWAVPTRHDHQSRHLKWRPGDVARSDKAGVTARG